MAHKCPPEVIEAGRALVKARKAADHMSDLIDDAFPKIETAVVHMHKEHGAKRMQAGATLARLRQAQMAVGLLMEAHDLLRHVLKECDVEEPTDAEIASIR